MSDSVLVVEENDAGNVDSEAMPKIVFSNAQSVKLFGTNLNDAIDTQLGDNLSQTQLILPQFMALENPYERRTNQQILKLDKLRE